MTAEAAIRLAAALEAAKASLEADYPELGTELGYIFRDNNLRNLTDRVKFYSGGECFASPARKAAGLAEAIVGLLSLKTAVERFDGEKLLAEMAAKRAALAAKNAAVNAAIRAECAAERAAADARAAAADDD